MANLPGETELPCLVSFGTAVGCWSLPESTHPGPNVLREANSEEDAHGFELSGYADKQVFRRTRYVDWSLEIEYEFGVLFGGRQGRKTYWLMLAGLYFDDKTEWEQFILPKLNYLATYEPR